MEVVGNYVGRIGQIFSQKVNVSSTKPMIITSRKDMKRRKGINHVEIQVPTHSNVSYISIGGPDIALGMGVMVESGSSRLMPVNTAMAGDFYMIADAPGEVIVTEYTE